MIDQSKRQFIVYLRKDCVWQYLVTGIFCTGLSIFLIGMLPMAIDNPWILFALPLTFVGPLNLYFFWYFAKYPAYQFDSNDGFVVFRALRKNLVIPASDIEAIRNLNDIRYRLELKNRKHEIIIINPTLAHEFHEVSFIPLL